MSSDEFEASTDTLLGAVLDTIIRKANLFELVEYYLGARVDWDQDVLELVFASEVDEARLEELKGSAEGIEGTIVTLAKEPGEEEEWVLRVEVQKEAELATVPAVSGAMEVDVPISGEIAVSVPGSLQTQLSRSTP